jgi:hypothetical protein
MKLTLGRCSRSTVDEFVERRSARLATVEFQQDNVPLVRATALAAAAASGGGGGLAALGYTNDGESDLCTSFGTMITWR